MACAARPRRYAVPGAGLLGSGAALAVPGVGFNVRRSAALGETLADLEAAKASGGHLSWAAAHGELSLTKPIAGGAQ